MGFANCSTSLVSIRTVSAQVEGALTAVDGDCQYVLLSVTVPPQVVIASVIAMTYNFKRSFRHDFTHFIVYLLMQQTFPRIQDPLGRPPNNEQMFPGAQIPASPLGEVQASKLANGLAKSGFTETGIRLARLAKGLHVFAGVNRLLKIPVLIRLAPNPPRAKRLSCWLLSS
jgi:hypothetical protein